MVAAVIRFLVSIVASNNPITGSCCLEPYAKSFVRVRFNNVGLRLLMSAKVFSSVMSLRTHYE